MKRGTKRKVFLWTALAVVIYLSAASVRLGQMCAFWDYYNYPKLRRGSQITFAELVRYAMWLQLPPSYSWSSCMAELRQVDGAIQQWALDHGKADEDQPTWNDLKPYFGSAGPNRPPPCCPYGGRYLLCKVEDMPRCTVREHGLPR